MMYIYLQNIVLSFFLASILLTKIGNLYSLMLNVLQEEILFGLKFSSLTIMRQTAVGYSSSWPSFLRSMLMVKKLITGDLILYDFQGQGPSCY